MSRSKPRKTGATRLRIGVSSCLLGERVRYDGGHKRNQWIARTLARHFELVPVCPEVAIGMGVPRPPIHLVRRGNSVRARGVHGKRPDVTTKLKRYGGSIARRHAGLCGYIFKARSPSCGIARVPLHDAKGRIVGIGTGIYAAAFMRRQPQLPVEDEAGLADPARRRDFIARVRAYARLHHLKPSVRAARTPQLSTRRQGPATNRASGPRRPPARRSRGSARP